MKSTISRRPVCLVILFLFLPFLPGCQPPATFGQPWLAVLPGDGAPALLSAQVFSYNQPEPGCRFFLATDAARTAWTPVLESSGSVAGLLAKGDELNVVFSDGTVTRWDNDKQQFERVRIGRAEHRFLHAALIGGQLHAVQEEAGGRLQLFVLGEEWTPAGPALTTVGNAALAWLVEQDGVPHLFWRQRVGARREPGLKGAALRDGQWQSAPVPDNDPTRGFFALLPLDEGGLLLVREAFAEPGMARETLLVSRFDGKRWVPISSGIPLSPELQRQHGLGLALAHDGEGLLLARADSAGVHLFRCAAKTGAVWRMIATPLEQKQGDLWGTLAILGALLAGFVLIGTSRLLFRRAAAQGREARPGPPGSKSLPAGSKDLPALLRQERTGAFASPMDRALAMAVDLLLVSPLPLFFWQASSHYDPLHMPREEWRLLYWVWLGGLSLYAAIAEGLWGQTLGKRLFRIRVRSLTGGPIRPAQAVIRNLLRFVDFWLIVIYDIAMPYLVALLTASFTGTRQRVGDLLAGTVVRRHTPLAKRTLVLASSSPRRRELLALLDLPFRVASPDVDETIDERAGPEENAVRLAKRKAETAARQLEGQEIVIGSDTLVVLDGEILGKPADREDAVRMLRMLSGARHTVITAVAVLDRATGQAVAGIDHTDVVFRPLSDEEVDAYVESGEADGKAGAYAIQETGQRFAAAVHGSLSNVIGLPLGLVERLLMQIDG